MERLPTRSKRACLLALALLAVASRDGMAAAQAGPRVHCGAGFTEAQEICLGKVARSDSLQRFDIELRLSGIPGGVSGIPVVFRPDSGAMLRDSVVTNDAGIARAIWYRPRGVGPAGIVADVRTASGSMFKYIRLEPRETPLRLTTAQDARIQNFPGGSGRSLIVEIRKGEGPSAVAITDTAECEQHRVAFLPEGTGARVTPDTAVATVYKAKQKGTPGDFEPGCFAGARVALGSEIGLHEIRTVGVPAVGHRVLETARFRAVNVRHLPQLIIAAVGSYHGDFTRLQTDTLRMFRVQRVLPSGETAAFDSAAVELSPERGGRGSTTAMIGFSTPIPWIGSVFGPANLVNLTVGVDPVNPRRSQFFGFSLLRSSGLVPHNFPVDLHFLGHLRQVERLDDPAGCAVALKQATCKTDTARYFGPAFAVSFDAGAVIGEAIKKLAN